MTLLPMLGIVTSVARKRRDSAVLPPAEMLTRKRLEEASLPASIRSDMRVLEDIILNKSRTEGWQRKSSLLGSLTQLGLTE